LTNFTKGIGGSSWWAINNAYSGVGYLPLSSVVTDTNYQYGKDLTIKHAWDYISGLMYAGYFPPDYNAIYMLVTSR
jgi:hypothetical protein